MNTDILKTTCGVFRTIMGYKPSALIVACVLVLCWTTASAAAPASAVWVGGDSSAPNDPTVLANWQAPNGTALSELPGSTTEITNNVSDEAKILIIEDGMDIKWNLPKIGFSGNGTMKMTGGKLTTSSHVYFGFWKGGNGSFEQTGGTVTINGTGQSRFGRSGTGSLTITGGTYSAPNSIHHIGHDAASSNSREAGIGTMTIGGDAKVTLGQALYLGIIENGGSSSTGTLYLNGGSLSVGDFYLSYGGSNTARGNVHQTGGSLTSAGAQTIGRNGGATYTQTGGTNTANGVINVANANAVIANYKIGPGELFANSGIMLAASGSFSNDQGGELTLNEGGIVTTKQIQRGTSSGNHYARVVCNGGKIVAKQNNTAFLKNLEFTYNAGGVTIDTKTYTVTATGCTTKSSAAEGSVVHKTGTGTLKYSALPLVDEIAVEEGTMAITANADVTSRSANVVSVASGAAFDCCGFTLSAQNLSGAGVVSNGTVTVAGTLSPDGTFAFGNATTVTVNGTVELAANETITLGAGATLDLTNATIKPPSGTDAPGRWVFASGPAGSITGTPKVAKGTGYCVKVAADGSSARLYRSGLIILFK